MKKFLGVANCLVAAILVLSLVPWLPGNGFGIAQGPVAPVPKISSLLDMQIKEKTRYIQNGGRARPDEVVLPRLVGRSIAEASQQKVFIHSSSRLGPSQLAELHSLGVVVYPDSWIPPFGNHPSGFVYAEAPVARIPEVAAKDYVAFLETAEVENKAQNNQARLATGVNDVWNLGYTGAGVTVAVLDSGVDLTHADIPTPVFKRDYSNYPTLDDTVANTVTGHGTHVAGTVLGRGTYSASNTGNGGGSYKGVAPGANLVFLKIGSDATGSASSGAMVNAIKAAVDTYGAKVINLSYGSWSQYHDGSDEVCQAVDYAVSHGAVMVVAAGNEGGDGQHYSSSVSAGSPATDFIQVNVSGPAASSSTVLSFNLVWFDGLGVHNTLALDYYDSSHTLVGSSTSFSQSESTKGTEALLTRMTGYVPSVLSGSSSTWYVKVRNLSNVTQPFHLYYNSAYNLSGGGWVSFESASPFYTLASPSEADTAIAVGAYVSRDRWTSYQQSPPSSYSLGETAGTIGSFSSRGPRVDPGAPGKPNLVAPGSAIISARDSNAHPFPPSPDEAPLYIDNDGVGLGPTNPGPANYYLSQGTSMASPHAAGIAALLLNKNPSLTPAQIRSYLETTATDKGAAGRDDTYGNGLVNALAAVNAVPAAAPPVASFTKTLNPTSGAAPCTVTFTDTSTGGPSSWSWNFGDGTGSSSQNPSKTYSSAGSYAVTLTATNAAGSSSASQTVVTYVAPVASFTGSATSGIAPLAVNFTDTSTGGPLSWSWSFGDGTGSSSQNPSKNYAAAGNYGVTLTAGNVAGSNTSSAQVVRVYSTPVAGFSKSASSGTAPLAVNFTDTSSGNPATWSWSFGDGTGSSSQNPSKTYVSAGNYSVTLTGGNIVGSSTSAPQVVNVYSMPVASFTRSSNPTNGLAPCTVTFTDSSTGNVTSWSWNFGDGSGSSLQNPSKTYNSAGSYTVTLTATNAAGSAPVSQTVNAYSVPAASFSASANSGTAPLTINFTDTSTGNVASWLWTYGDGATSSTQNPSKTYATYGTYTVTLTATNPLGNSSASAVKQIYSVPVAAFSASATGANPGAAITFTDQSTGNVTGWSWNFGDGTGSSSQNPTKSYVSTGNYTVSLTAANPAGSNALTRSGYITIASAAVSLQSETLLVPDLDASGYAVVHARINRIKNAANGETFAIGDGFGAYNAYVTYDAAGVTAVSVAGVAPFSSPSIALNTLSGTRSTFSASQTSPASIPPANLADVRLRLIGSKDIPYTATLTFVTIATVGGTGAPQAGDAVFTFRRGDANSNGSVTIADALFVAQYLAGLRGLGTDTTTVNPVNAASVRPDVGPPDVGDKITIADALFIAQMLAGLRTASYN